MTRASGPDIDADTQIWIVEDNAFLRDTVVELLDRHAGMQCTLAAGSCEEALEALRRGRVPQVVLMDLGLPGMSGIDGIARIRRISPASHIIVLTVHEDDDNVFEALCAGASGYLLKPASSEEIVAAVETVLRGGAPMNAFIARKVLSTFTRFARPPADHGLTDREREILQFLVEERTQKQIAQALFLSPLFTSSIRRLCRHEYRRFNPPSYRDFGSTQRRQRCYQRYMYSPMTPQGRDAFMISPRTFTECVYY